MKKLCVVLALMVGIMVVSTSALAGSHHNGGSRYKVCSRTDCSKTGVHKHGKISYYPHHLEDGHGYHNHNGHH